VDQPRRSELVERDRARGEIALALTAAAADPHRLRTLSRALRWRIGHVLRKLSHTAPA